MKGMVDMRSMRKRNVTVIGAARSGLAVALLLRRHGAEVFVTEQGGLAEHVRDELASVGIAFEEGGHSTRGLEAEFCVLSPGISPESDFPRAVSCGGIPLLSEIEVASHFCNARIAAVTGTDGKTTTVSLLEAICHNESREQGFAVFSAGNIGVPFSAVADRTMPEDIVVLELSSYQLEGCQSFRPEVAVITNIAPDHLDRYGGSLERYAEAKFRIFSHQKPGDTLVLNADDLWLQDSFHRVEAGYRGRLCTFGLDASREQVFSRPGAFLRNGLLTLLRENGQDEPLLEASQVLKRGFSGEHNLSNALAATAAAAALGISVGAISKGLQEFSGVEHRQEYVKEIRGITCINDAKATNLNALKTALEACDGKLVLIAGGRDKGGDLQELQSLVADRVAAMVVIGEAALRFRKAFEGMVPVMTAGSLGEAVRLGLEHARPGQTLLFSPGCSSFDMFSDFEERGRMFKKILEEGV